MGERRWPVATSGDDRDADARAFRALFDALFEPLFRFAGRFVGSPETAEDVVHDVFLRLWEQRDRIDLRGELRAYLYAATRNRALDHLKRRAVEDRAGGEHPAAALSDQGLAIPPDGEERVERDETARAIRDAIEGLPRRQQQVLLLRWRRQLTHAEIASLLGISVKTVAIHMGRALQALRATLPRMLD